MNDLPTFLDNLRKQFINAPSLFGLIIGVGGLVVYYQLYAVHYSQIANKSWITVNANVTRNNTFYDLRYSVYLNASYCIISIYANSTPVYYYSPLIGANARANPYYSTLINETVPFTICK